MVAVAARSPAVVVTARSSSALVVVTARSSSALVALITAIVRRRRWSLSTKHPCCEFLS